jgi:hypothetical protein
MNPGLSRPSGLQVEVDDLAFLVVNLVEGFIFPFKIVEAPSLGKDCMPTRWNTVYEIFPFVDGYFDTGVFPIFKGFPVDIVPHVKSDGPSLDR